MSTLSLRISLEGGRVTKTIQFDPSTTVFDACRIIKDKFAEAVQGQAQEFGLFLADDDTRQGVWLEPARNLGYYMLHNHDVLEYRQKHRTLRVRMLDGAVKTILVDDSQPVSQLMVVICTKIGITNHEEYGLVREDPEAQNENQPDNRSNTGTLTLRRKAQEKERDAKMESLRKKLRTDDEINWVDVGKTLREQGIDEQETVLLRRKFFYSDQNIDSRDPVQLNLLYVQARDAILDGTHPVTQDKACEFAGIQVQIQFGDHNEAKHRPGFLDLREFLPASYVRTKNIERKIFAEHRKHVGLSDLDAKYEYTKTARELPTYGVTFFLVKEKMTGKNKLVPRLLGVTKDSVLRLDETTKEILKSWPLTTVRRWGASPNTFTLDFGDYADSYYSVQTTEAEQIVQLIAGYIDIILKKKQAKDHFGIEGDEGSTMVEESVAPSKATFLQHEETNKGGKVETHSIAKPAIMRGTDGERSYGTGEMQSIQYGAIVGQVNLAHQPPMLQQTRISSVLSEPQRALLGYISAGQDALNRAEKDLESKVQLPPLGTDPGSLQWREETLDTSKQTVTTHLATMNAATAQVVTASQPDEIDHEAVGAAVSQITQSIPEVTKEVRLIAALMDDDCTGDKLLEATRKLCNAFSDLLRSAEPESKEPRQNLLNAATRVGEASGQVLSTIGEESVESRELHDMLLGLAKAVANTTAALVLKAKSIAAVTEDEATRNKVIGAASQCALATSQLVACARVVGPTIQSPACREQLEAAAREVAKAVAHLAEVCNEATDNQQLRGDLTAAAKDVSKSLTDLLEHIKLSAREKARRVENENPVDNVLVATDILVSSSDPQEMIRQAQQLGKATAQLIQSIKGEAESQHDSNMQRKLLEAAKQLADATARMVEAARLCAGNPHDSGHQEMLRTAAEELRVITTSTANTPAIKRQLIGRLEQCARQAASSATQCITAAQNSLIHSNDVQTKEILLQDCQAVADQIPRLVAGVKGTHARPDDPNAQLCLIDAAEMFLEPGAQMAGSARELQPTVMDQAAGQQLGRSSVNLTHAIHDLRLAAHRAREACGGNELDAALEAVRNLRSVLSDTRRAAQEGSLRPLPGETADSCFKQLAAASNAVDVSMHQLMSAAQQGNRTYAGVAGRDTALALGDYTKSVRGVLVTTKNPAVVDCADEVIVDSLRVIEEAQRTLQNLDNQEALLIAIKRTKHSLGRTIDCLPGVKDINEAFETVTDLRSILDTGEYPPSDRPYGQLQNELKSAADQLNVAGGQVAQSYDSSIKLAGTSQEFCHAYKELLTVTLEMAGQTAEDRAREEIVNSLRGVSNQSISLLGTARYVAGDPDRPNAKNELSSAARLVTESINRLVDVCTQAAPGQKECDGAIRSIESLRPLLESPQESLTDQGYFDCLDTVLEKSRTLGEGMTGIANNAKNSKHVEFGHSVNSVSESIRGLIESAAQAAYLVGVSNPTSVGGRPGIVDPAQYARAAQAIRQSCDVLRGQASSQPQVLSAATVIAKHTSALCNACRNASSTTTNPVAKRHFVQAAKEVANSTAALVREIKALDQDYSPASRQRCAAATEPLLEAVSSLCHFASSPEFISIPARISTEGRKAQEPILTAGRGILDGAVDMVRTAKVLALTPTDPPVWQQLATHSRNVSESIKQLASSIREKAPGQMQCDQVLEVLKDCSRELNSAALAVGVDGLPQRKDSNLQGFTNQSLNAASELIDRLEPVKSSAKKNAESLGHAVNQIAKHIVPLTNGVIGACSQLVHSGQQTVLINQVKSVVECCAQLVQTAKQAGGNPRAAHFHPELDEAVESTREAIQELNATVERLSTENGVVTGLMEQISRSMSRISDKRQSFLGASLNDTYVDYQTRMVQSAKEIARYANEINAKAAIDPSKLAQLCVEMTHHYTQLAQDSIGASALTTSPDVAIRIRNTVQDLGRSVNVLIQSTTGIRKDDSSGLVEISRGARDVSEKVAQVLAALQAGSRGTQACINASSTVSAIISDLDTTIMFATAGTLQSSDEDGKFSDHREHILKTAKALVEDTKILVAGAAGTQDQLAAAAQNAVTTILQLADAVKHGAASLGSGQPDSQVMVINAVKDVAAALGELINATKLASGKPINDPAMNDLKDSAKVMVMNVTSLLKTVKAVEDEHTRGTRAMEATVDAISQELRSMQFAPEMMRSSMQQLSRPEDLISVTKHVTAATAKAVAAGASNLQADIAAAANLGRKTISDMLSVCKSVAWSCAETQDLRQRTLDAGSAVAIAYRDLLEGILSHCTADERMQLSRRVAMCVTDLVGMAQLLKGSDWVDPDDPTVIAENELLGAAASIEAAAKKLANLRPRRQEVKEADENLNFDEMILEAAKSIMAASSSLVRAANAAQRELIDQGKVAKRPLTSSDDGQWSEGLISAARLVAAATHSLVEAAQNLVQGVGTEEMLISSAKQVASSTAQLLIACKVKSDPNSETGRRLQAAGNAVIKSTDKLVQAAQQAIEGEEEHTLRLNRNMVDGMAQEINARSEILMRERQLEEAKNKLIAIRHAKYRQKLGGGFTTDESDEGGVAPPPFAGYSQPTSPKPPQTLPKPGTYSPGSLGASPAQGASTMPRLGQHSPASPSFQRPGSGNQLLTANAVPKPYQSDALKSPSALVSPSMLNRTYDTTRVENTNLSASKFNRTQFDAAVQDLQNKVQPLSTFRSSPTHTNGGVAGSSPAPQTYEGFTTRYETRVFQNANNTNPQSPNPLTTVEQKFAKLNLDNHDMQQQQQQQQQQQPSQPQPASQQQPQPPEQPGQPEELQQKLKEQQQPMMHQGPPAAQSMQNFPHLPPAQSEQDAAPQQQHHQSAAEPSQEPRHAQHSDAPDHQSAQPTGQQPANPAEMGPAAAASAVPGNTSMIKAGGGGPVGGGRMISGGAAASAAVSPSKQNQMQTQQVASPTPLAFTPTSVLRKMTAAQEKEPDSAIPHHMQQQQQQLPPQQQQQGPMPQPQLPLPPAHPQMMLNEQQQQQQQQGHLPHVEPGRMGLNYSALLEMMQHQQYMKQQMQQQMQQHQKPFPLHPHGPQHPVMHPMSGGPQPPQPPPQQQQQQQPPQPSQPGQFPAESQPPQSEQQQQQQQQRPSPFGQPGPHPPPPMNMMHHHGPGVGANHLPVVPAIINPMGSMPSSVVGAMRNMQPAMPNNIPWNMKQLQQSQSNVPQSQPQPQPGGPGQLMPPQLALQQQQQQQQQHSINGGAFAGLNQTMEPIFGLHTGPGGMADARARFGNNNQQQPNHFSTRSGKISPLPSGNGLNGGFGGMFRNTSPLPESVYSSAKSGAITSDYAVKISNLESVTGYGEIRRFFKSHLITTQGIKMINDQNGRRTGTAYIQFLRKEGKKFALSRDGSAVRRMRVRIESITDQEFDSAVDSYRPGMSHNGKAWDDQNPRNVNPWSTNDYSNEGRNGGGRAGSSDVIEIADDRDEPRHDSGRRPPPVAASSALVVWNLPTFTTEQDIMKMFSDFTVVEVLIVKNHHAPKQLDGYVKFHRQEDAQEAWKQVHRHFIGNKKVTVLVCQEIDYEVAKNEHENPRDVEESSSFEQQQQQQQNADGQMERERTGSENGQSEEQESVNGSSSGNGGNNGRQGRSSKHGSRWGSVERPWDDDTSENIALKNMMLEAQRRMNAEAAGAANAESNGPWNVRDDRMSRGNSLGNDSDNNGNSNGGNQSNEAINNMQIMNFINNMNQMNNNGNGNQQQQQQQQQGGGNSRDPRRANSRFAPSNDSSEMFQRTNWLLLRNVDFHVYEEDVFAFFGHDGFQAKNVLLVHNERGGRTGECLVEFGSASEAAHAESKSSQNLGRRKVFASHLDRGQVADLMARFHAIAQGLQPSHWLPDHLRNENSNGGGGSGGGGGGGGSGSGGSQNDDPEKNQGVGCGPYRTSTVGLLNLAYKTTVEDVQKFFQEFNLPLENIRRRFLDNGNATGEAMVRFRNHQDAEKALNEYQNRKLFGRNVRLRLINDD